MSERKSFLMKHEVGFLTRKMQTAQLGLLEWAEKGYQEKGLHDDMQAVIKLYELRDTIDRILKRGVDDNKRSNRQGSQERLADKQRIRN